MRIVVLAIAAILTGQTPPATPAAIWQSITYPSLEIPGVAERMTVRVSSGGRSGEPVHLRLDLLWSSTSPSQSAMPGALANAGAIGLALHTADGKVALSSPDGLQEWVGIGGGGSTTWSLMRIVPWARNALDEAWFELRVANRKYWLELPYGFARNPADPETPDPSRGPPEFPPAMRALADADVLVPWQQVEYDLGGIQNRWRLGLKIANPFDARAEVILYRDDSRVGQSRYLWKLDTPRTGLSLERQGEPSIAGLQIGARLHDDGMRRSDDYSLGRNSSDGRGWATATIRVDDASYAVRVPSSLFKYVHGVTEPHHPKRIRG
jgi:hypothetical protein